MLRKWLARKRGQIYRYHTGMRKVYVDPIELWYRLFDDATFDLRGALVDVFSAETPKDIQNEQYFASTDFIVRQMGIASINPASGKGLSREQAMETFLEFVDWVSEIKKKRDAYRDMSPSLESPNELRQKKKQESNFTCDELKSCDPPSCPKACNTHSAEKTETTSTQPSKTNK